MPLFAKANSSYDYPASATASKPKAKKGKKSKPCKKPVTITVCRRKDGRFKKAF